MCCRQKGLDPFWWSFRDGVKVVLVRVLEPVFEEPLLGRRWGEECALVVHCAHLDRFLGLLSFPFLTVDCRCLAVKELGQLLPEDDTTDTGA